MLFSVTACVHLPEPVLATDSNSNPGTFHTCWCPRLSPYTYTSVTDSVRQISHQISPQKTVHMLWEKCSSRGLGTRTFSAPFPECSGTKVSYRVSLSTFQLPIIEQIALNQIYSQGLFFVIWVQSDYRIMTELCLKWWKTTWILLVMCSPLARLMLLYCRHAVYEELCWLVQIIKERWGTLYCCVKTLVKA